jgi:hypothetical protein
MDFEIDGEEILVEDSVSYEGIPSHLHRYWRNMHIKYRCPQCEKCQTKKEAFARGYSCIGHPRGPTPFSKEFKGSMQHGCCGMDTQGRGAWLASGCTRMLCRLPAQRSFVQPFIAVPARLVKSGHLLIHGELLARAIYIETENDASESQLYSFDHLDHVVPFIAQTIIESDGVTSAESTVALIVPSTNIFDYIDLIMEPEPRSQAEIDADPANTHLHIQNSAIDPFEIVMLVPIFDNKFDKSRISVIRKNLATWRNNAGDSL